MHNVQKYKQPMENITFYIENVREKFGITAPPSNVDRFVSVALSGFAMMTLTVTRYRSCHANACCVDARVLFGLLPFPYRQTQTAVKTRNIHHLGGGEMYEWRVLGSLLSSWRLCLAETGY